MRDHAHRIRLVSAAAVVALWAGSLLAQISPGPLSAPHEKLEGATECFRCHAGHAGSADEKCLECHEAIGVLRERKRGLHGRSRAEDCSSCHPEHAGRDFQLIEWKSGSPELFHHDRTGWPLAGKHAQVECRQCHQSRRQSPELLALRPGGDGEESWLGLDGSCGSCHQDPHRGALGQVCLTCHNQQAWKPAPAFSHAKTDFPLEGKHTGLECGKCHLAPGLKPARDREGRPVPLFKPLPHEQCSRCHEDVHRGRLGSECSRCHVAGGFRQVDRQRFDHAATRYPLLGKHRTVDCAACHTSSGVNQPRPAFDKCSACHADAHGRAAGPRLRGLDCAACHDERGFSPALFTLEQHEKTAYPLEGKHQSVTCRACHPKLKSPAGQEPWGSARILLRPKAAACRDCHRDAHGDQLADRPDRGACASCHDVRGFKPSRFSVEQHAQLRLPLEGQHAEIACGRCHAASAADSPASLQKRDRGPSGVLLALGGGGCADCHADPHQGRLAGEPGLPDGQGCRSCHDARRFRPSAITIESHERLGFPLTGAHSAVACPECHRDLDHRPQAASLRSARPAPGPLLFGERRQGCAECHQGPHGDQFARRASGRGPTVGASLVPAPGCDHCHGVESFRPASRFDHERDTAFPLGGAHVKVPCAECHSSQPDGKGGTRFVYRPTPSRCQDCHRGSVPGQPPAPARRAGPAGRQRPRSSSTSEKRRGAR